MLSECSVYMTLINHKPIQQNYKELKQKVMTEGVNPRLVRSVLLNEIKARANDPDRVKKLYRRLSYRLNNLKKKKDPVLEHMALVILNEETDFETRVAEMVEYLYSNKELKGWESKDTIINRCVDIYYTATSRKQNHQEAALRALISIPFKLVTKFDCTKLLKYGGILLILGLFGEILYNALIVKNITFTIAELTAVLVSFIIIKFTKLSGIVKTIWHS